MEDDLAIRLDALLDQLDLAAEADVEKVKRRSARARYRRRNVTVRIDHPGGTTTRRLVVTRNLSAGGIGFLINGFLHLGTRCQLTLPRIDGGQDIISAFVVSCYHVSGPYHVVGLQFTQKIDPRQYVDADRIARLSEDPSPMRGRILLLDDLEAEHDYFRLHLRQTEIEVVCCLNVTSAIERLRQQRFDLVITELGLSVPNTEPVAPVTPVERSVAVLRRIRESGYTRRLALCTAESDHRVLRAAHEHNIIGVLRKPYRPRDQLNLIEQWLQQEPYKGQTTRSSLGDKAELQPMIRQFVRFANVAGHKLVEVIRHNQVHECRLLCVKLFGAAGNLGFAPLRDAAGSAATSLEKTNSIKQSLGHLYRLRNLCSDVAA